MNWELENNVKNAKEELDKLILSGLLVNDINIDCTDLDKVWQVHFYQGANFKGSISFSNTIKEFSLREVLLGKQIVLFLFMWEALKVF
ncbi:hypothetical protein [Providencia huaxiensis]|uniref:hypothetical protein n=1 Tax=Providencia huaxiensis TaxID=2027290 RepID=UPI0034DDB168